ncbi:unnamed protein product, partial [Staurois parvus]
TGLSPVSVSRRLPSVAPAHIQSCVLIVESTHTAYSKTAHS